MGIVTFRYTSVLTPALSFSYEHGINTFDTADMYSNGLSEKILGRAIKQLNLPREEIVVLTKVHLSRSRRIDTNTDDVQRLTSLGPATAPRTSLRRARTPMKLVWSTNGD